MSRDRWNFGFVEYEVPRSWATCWELRVIDAEHSKQNQTVKKVTKKWSQSGESAKNQVPSKGRSQCNLRASPAGKWANKKRERVWRRSIRTLLHIENCTERPTANEKMFVSLRISSTTWLDALWKVGMGLDGFDLWVFSQEMCSKRRLNLCVFFRVILSLAKLERPSSRAKVWSLSPSWLPWRHQLNRRILGRWSCYVKKILEKGLQRHFWDLLASICTDLRHSTWQTCGFSCWHLRIDQKPHRIKGLNKGWLFKSASRKCFAKDNSFFAKNGRFV